MNANEKPHRGRIKDWARIPLTDPPGGYRIAGTFLDHPEFPGGGDGMTSFVVTHDGDEIETRNSRYTLVKEGQPSTPSPWPQPGEKMRFLGQNGHAYQREEALKHFKVDELYEVVDCEVGDWSHSIRFKDIEGYFNGVMFKLVRDAAD